MLVSCIVLVPAPFWFVTLASCFFNGIDPPCCRCSDTHVPHYYGSYWETPHQFQVHAPAEACSDARSQRTCSAIQSASSISRVRGASHNRNDFISGRTWILGASLARCFGDSLRDLYSNTLLASSPCWFADHAPSCFVFLGSRSCAVPDPPRSACSTTTRLTTTVCFPFGRLVSQSSELLRATLEIGPDKFVPLAL